MTQYIAGPWRVAHVALSDEGYRDILDAPGNRIAAMSAGGNGQNLAANARLMAAAPDLLGALRLMLKPYEDMQAEDFAPFMRESLTAARIAIAKAERG